MPVRMLPDDLELSFDALLRNRLDGLGWAYFEVDLDAAAADPRALADEEEIRAFFARLRAAGAGAPAPAATTLAERKAAAADTANEAMAYFFALLRQDRDALATFIRARLMPGADGGQPWLLNRADADVGTLGKLNRRERRRRNRAFDREMDAGHREREGAVVVLAEGDSWFQFPKLFVVRPVRDLVYYLLRDPKYAVKTLAAGGDWLAAIVDEDEVVGEIAAVRPDVLLLSGGGNDLVGGYDEATRTGGLRTMLADVPHDPAALPDPLARLLRCRENAPTAQLDLARYRNGLRFVGEAYLDFLNKYFLVYFHLAWQLHHDDDLAELLVVTQGYDYVLPNGEPRGGIVQRIVNRIVGNGKWLYRPLVDLGIGSERDRRDVLYAMLYEFNEMLITLARYSGFPRLFHLDVRGFAEAEDWFDELHLVSEKNRVLARNYQGLMTQYLNPFGRGELNKVWRVRG